MAAEASRDTGLTPLVASSRRSLVALHKGAATHSDNCLPITTRVRYLYAPGEAEGDNQKRATDPISSL